MTPRGVDGRVLAKRVMGAECLATSRGSVRKALRSGDRFAASIIGFGGSRRRSFWGLGLCVQIFFWRVPLLTTT